MQKDSLKQQLIIDEDLKLKPYRDSVGKLTIGVGRNLDDVGLTREEALQLLDNDIQRAYSELTNALPWTQKLDDARQNVLLNMTFNLGIGRLLGFKKTLEFVRLGEFEEAAVEMLDSTWARQVGARATRLADVMRSGVLQ